MIAIRSHFAPDNLEGIELGDTVYFHVTNIEQDWNIGHGFAVFGATTAGVILPPGSTRTMVWVPQGVGVYPFYCTDFLLRVASRDAGVRSGVRGRFARATDRECLERCKNADWSVAGNGTEAGTTVAHTGRTRRHRH